MGRSTGKLKVSFIENQKTRNQTFKRRKEGVMKKVKELSTLCDVSACLVLFSPEHDAPTAPPSIWPPNDPALVRGLVRAKNPNSENDDGEVAQFVVRLGKKAQEIRDKLDRLKSDQDQFVFVASPDVADQQQDQFAQFGEFGPCNQYPEQQQQQFELFASSSSMTMYQGEDPSTAMMVMMDDAITADQNWCTMYQGEDPSTAMMVMMDEAITADQNWCTMAGFGGQEEEEEGASCSTQTGGGGGGGGGDGGVGGGGGDGGDVAVQDCNLNNHYEDDFNDFLVTWQSTFQENGAAGGDADVAAVQDYDFYDDDFTAQLLTPPMMTCQSTFTHGAADYSKSIDFDDLWV